MKYEIEIEGLPEGWVGKKLVLRSLIENDENEMTVASLLTLQKIKPRRIVLEETTELRIPNPGEWYCTSNGSIAQCYGIKVTPALIWKEIKENELDSIPQK